MTMGASVVVRMPITCTSWRCLGVRCDSVRSHSGAATHPSFESRKSAGAACVKSHGRAVPACGGAQNTASNPGHKDNSSVRRHGAKSDKAKFTAAKDGKSNKDNKFAALNLAMKTATTVIATTTNTTAATTTMKI